MVTKGARLGAWSLQGSRDGRLRYEATAATSAAGFSNANRSPGWQSSTSQSFSGVSNRMALAPPVFDTAPRTALGIAHRLAHLCSIRAPTSRTPEEYSENNSLSGPE